MLKNKISDEELISTLKKHGIDSPVTATTRNILIKKLNSLLNEEKNVSRNSNAVNDINSYSTQSPKRRPVLNLGSYSSDEDEVDDGRHPYSNSPQDFNDTYGEQSRFIGKRRSKRISLSPENRLVRDETSSVGYGSKLPRREDQPSLSYSNNSRRKDHSNLNYSNNSFFNDMNKSYTDNQYDSYSDSDIDESPPNTNESSYSDRENPFNAYKNFKFFDSKEDTRNLPIISTVASNSHRGTETRIIHNRKLLCDKVVSPDDIVTREAQSSNSFVDGLQDLSSLSESFLERSWSQCISLLLLALFVCFFLIVGLCYININTSSNVFSHLSSSIPFGGNKILSEDQQIDAPHSTVYSNYEDDSIPMCKDKGETSNCLTVDERLSLLEILNVIEKVLVPELKKQGSSYQCGLSDIHYIKRDRITEILKNNLPEKYEKHIENGFYGFSKLVNINDNFGLQTIWNKDGSPKGMAVYPLPNEYLCHFVNFLKKLLYLVSFVIIGCLGCIVIIKLLKMNSRRLNEKENECFELVEKILKYVERECVNHGKEYVVVEHVRDYLIEPRQRIAKSRLWNNALQFIKEHESRVAMEVHVVNGEERQVWRWSSISQTSLHTPEKTNDKVWQGNAFESIESTQDLPRISPSSCLKIRKMFRADLEHGNEWPNRIKESILEKCSSAKIIHIAVDQESLEGCVYVKCANVNDAYLAFRALQGTWYNGNLVTVKFLRDEKYHLRFPDARYAKKVLRPVGTSNNSRK